ncbi:MAG: hypothetical protein R3D67_11045 [Hyphomicrobiaceae bacterium]
MPPTSGARAPTQSTLLADAAALTPAVAPQGRSLPRAAAAGVLLVALVGAGGAYLAGWGSGAPPTGSATTSPATPPLSGAQSADGQNSGAESGAPASPRVEAGVATEVNNAASGVATAPIDPSATAPSDDAGSAAKHDAVASSTGVEQTPPVPLVSTAPDGSSEIALPAAEAASPALPHHDAATARAQAEAERRDREAQEAAARQRLAAAAKLAAEEDDKRAAAAQAAEAEARSRAQADAEARAAAEAQAAERARIEAELVQMRARLKAQSDALRQVQEESRLARLAADAAKEKAAKEAAAAAEHARQNTVENSEAAKPRAKTKVASLTPSHEDQSSLGRFDGRWTLTRIGEKCRLGRVRSFSFRIESGKTTNGRGRVTSSGSFKYNGQSKASGKPMHFTGSLKQNSGRGTFYVEGGRCEGTFTVSRE